MSILRRVGGYLSLHRASVGLIGLVAAGGAAVGIFMMSSGGTYPIKAVFPSAQGLFPGAAVRLLGVQVGTVTGVNYSEGAVDVSMQIDRGQTLPKGVHAALAAPLLLGEPDIELSPGYTGGAALWSGATIPESSTAVPVSTADLLKQLQRVLGAVPPTSAHDLVANLASDLSGQGDEINELVKGASTTLSLLASKGTELGQLNGSLASLTSTLDAHETELLQLLNDYDTVSTEISQHQASLGAAIDDLSTASRELAGLLSPNLKPLESDVGVVTTVGRTLDRNLSNLDSVLASSRSLFAHTHTAYDPQYQWLDLNNQLAPGLTAGVVEGLVRDRLAGVCRRILANHSSGLSSSQKATLAQCGNQDSGFFDPELGLIPRILAGEPVSSGSSSAPSLGSLLGPGLAKIPGLSPSQRKKISKAASSTGPPSSTKKPTGSGSTGSKSGSGGVKTPPPAKKKKKCKGVDGAINCILGPLP